MKELKDYYNKWQKKFQIIAIICWLILEFLCFLIDNRILDWISKITESTNIHYLITFFCS